MKGNLVTIAASLFAVSMATPVLAQGSGATIYKGKCQMCHPADGSGNKAMKVPTFSADASEATLIADTENGIRTGPVKMPAYAGKLTDADITSVVAYIRPLQK